MKIFLSFDFYGAGNIGDDLMLDGFLRGLKNKNYEFYCYIPRDSTHQKKRFPEINFIDLKNKSDISNNCGIWAGVGDTPIQIKSGDWFLRKLSEDTKALENKNTKYFFLGIGAESEAVSQKSKYTEILSRVDHFWTRDRSSSEIILKNFNLNREKVSVSADLANISLAELFRDAKKNKDTEYDIGICYYDEDSEKDNLTAIKIFLKNLKKSKKKLLFSNEVSRKRNFEYKIYKNMFTRFERFMNNIEIYHPDYFNLSSVKDLLIHYSKCDIVMSSRYHAILAAAWAGCKIVILERTSKVSALAEELSIKEIKKPFTPEKLAESLETAQKASMEIMNKLYIKACEGVLEFEDKIKN